MTKLKRTAPYVMLTDRECAFVLACILWPLSATLLCTGLSATIALIVVSQTVDNADAMKALAITLGGSLISGAVIGALAFAIHLRAANDAANDAADAAADSVIGVADAADDTDDV